MATYQVLYWRNIPAQVKAYDGARGRSRALPEAFQRHIDRLAMQQGLTGTDAYLEQWQWSEKREHDGTATQTLDAVCAELIAQWQAIVE